MFNKLFLVKEIFKLKYLVNNENLFFFFPAYHVGGAERVHLDILNVFSENKKICFFTSKSENDALKEDFEKVAKTFQLDQLAKKKYAPIALKLIAKEINKRENPIIFGCNSHFFYDLIPFLGNHVKIIDLIHAFSYEYKDATEKYSLPYTNRIDKRVVLGSKTKNDFTKLYFDNNIDKNLLERITIIPNGIDFPQTIYKKENEILKVLFVSRNSVEKRPNIFFKVAESCSRLKLPVEFFVIGDFEIQNDIKNNVSIIGLVKEKEKINEYYKIADLLLVTSIREGFPMVILEGMTFGVVPISTNVGEISSFINKENQNGILVENFADEQKIVDCFVESITDLCENREKLNYFSKNAFLTVKQNFSKENFSNSYQHLFFNS